MQQVGLELFRTMIVEMQFLHGLVAPIDIIEFQVRLVETQCTYRQRIVAREVDIMFQHDALHHQVKGFLCPVADDGGLLVKVS